MSKHFSSYEPQGKLPTITWRALLEYICFHGLFPSFFLSGLTWVCSSGSYSFLSAVSGLQIKQSGCQWSSSSWKNLLGAQHLFLLNFKIRNTSLVFQCLRLADDAVIRMHLGQRAHFDGELARKMLV